VSATSHSPMRWRCSEHGCYNDKLRLKFGVFKDCLPGKISFTDVDGTVEVNGYFLFLEWKSGMPAELNAGQRIFFQNLTRLSRRIKAILAAGDAETMEVSHIKIIANGTIGPWEQVDIGGLKQRIKAWSDRARSMPRFAGAVR
jgi:hypothetical protein